MTIVIGIDCATKAAKTGLAQAAYKTGRANILDACVDDEPTRRIASWIRAAREPVLLALDAPLGWPRPLSIALARHRAGSPLPDDTDDLFQRTTDQDVKERWKRPLEVGANLIARTAHAALVLLKDLRSETGHGIELAWRRDALERVSAIEVYPAATLLAHNVDPTRHKGPREDDAKERRRILEGVSRAQRFQGMAWHRSAMLGDRNVLDAVVCVLAGIDFLEGRSVPPTDQPLALREGWIWVPGRKMGASKKPAGR